MCPPTLDDAPTIATLTGDVDLSAGESSISATAQRIDLIQVYDSSTQKPKTITIQELGEALGITFI